MITRNATNFTGFRFGLIALISLSLVGLGCEQDELWGASSGSCGNGTVEAFERCDASAEPPLYPLVGCRLESCDLDFSQVQQLYCNGTCTWAGATSCDQADADIFCKLKTGSPDSVATSFSLATALDEHGFSCPNQPSVGDNLGTVPEYGVTVEVWYNPTSILTSHGSGTIVTNVVCEDM